VIQTPENWAAHALGGVLTGATTQLRRRGRIQRSKGSVEKVAKEARDDRTMGFGGRDMQ